MVVYRIVRQFVRWLVFPMLRVKAVNVDVLNLDGPTILAPVHRSHLDSVLLATLSTRRIRALGKESLFTTPVVRYFCAALGAIPVRRGEADRDALTAAKALLDRGESMIVFPEGSRQDTNEVGELFDGAAWLASRTGARVVPVGIAGTREALPEGAKFLHRSSVGIVVGEPMEVPVGENGKRPNRHQLRAFTAQLRLNLQAAQNQATELARR
jgi:1-acyl-sn-glycerol-3-phosphate acyltransferase